MPQNHGESLLSGVKEQWEATFDAITDWVSIIDNNYTIIRSNSAVKELAGHSQNDVVGKRCYEIVHGMDCPISNCPLARAVKSRQRETMEIQLEDGLWILVSVDPIRNGSQAQRFVHIVRDITGRKRAEAEKAKLEAQNRLLHKDESLARMAGAIAHHFNNQLSVVLGNLELALDDLPDDAAVRENVIAAIQATRRSTDISGLMLTYLGQGTFKRTPLDLADTCGRHLPMLRNVVPKGISLETDLKAPGPIVPANSNQILQILTHLITNGVEAIGARSGRICLTAKILPAADIPEVFIAPVDWKPAAGRYACLEVTDTGTGMTDRDMEKIFDPFFTTKFTGRGLGLAVVLGIVKMWDGAVSVESRKNHGSTFRVFLPLLEDRTAPSPGKAPRGHGVEKGGTVLLVENHADLREMAQTMIRRLGFSVIAAAGGAEAVDLINRHPGVIRCVITDLTMPGMDGWDTIATLRKIQPDLPVILSSGYDEAIAMCRNVPEKPNSFLPKPYSMDALKKALDRALLNAARLID